MDHQENWVIPRDKIQSVKELMDYYPERVMLVGLDKKIEWINQRVKNQCGEVVGLYCHDVLTERPSDCQGCHIAQTIESKHHTKEHRVIHKDNIAILCENWSVPVLNALHQVESILIINRTWPKGFINSTSNKGLYRPHKDHGFLPDNTVDPSRISHSLKTPLNGLFGIIQLMKDTDFPEEQEELYDLLTITYGEMLKKVEQFEGVTLIHNDPKYLITEVFSVNKVLNQAHESVREQAMKQDLRIKHTRLSPESDTVQADRYRLLQLMTLWLEVFIENLNRGLIEVSGKIHHYEMQEGILFHITGHGNKLIFSNPEHYTSTHGLFMKLEKYHQHNQLMETLKGVEMNDHDIQSNLSYSFWLPLPTAVTTVDKKELPKQITSYQKKGTKKRHQLLIVEDDFLSRMTYQMSLSKSYDIVFAKTGNECLSIYQNEKPDLVILDIMLPDINGFEVFERIEEIDSAHPPIIACTARVLNTEANYLKSFGFIDYLPKPIQHKELKDLLNYHLEVTVQVD